MRKIARVSRAAAAFMLTAAPSMWPAVAQMQRRVHQCDNKNVSFDQRISGCTAAIRSGKWKGRDLAWVHLDRGVAWRAKGDNNRAIADYDQAIRLNPKLAIAYNNRGNAWRAKGDDRAI